MNKNLIVTIFVPQAGKEKEGKIGTGYPVAENLILTSRHTIDGGNGEIRVRWHHYRDEDAPSTGWIVQSVDDIVWKGEGKLDAVLLRCPRPEKAQGKGWGRIAEKNPPSGERWESQGFPCATRCESVRNPDNVSGTTESMADQEYHFELIVNCPPKDTDMWRGASGMPVFVHGEIFGVVDSVPENFNGKKLYAVPSWKMFEDEKFRELIKPFIEEEETDMKIFQSEYKMKFVNALLDCPSMRDQGAREAVIDNLPGSISNNYKKDRSSKVDVYNLVSYCLDYPNGIEYLVRAVAFYDEGSMPMEKVNSVYKQMKN